VTNYWDTIGEPGPVGSYTIHSGDTHVVEPPDLWTTRLPKGMQDRAPHVERVGARDFWFCEGMNLCHTGYKASRWNPEQYSGVIDDQRPGARLPGPCAEDSDLDGVDVNVFFPSPAITFYAVPDSELLKAIFRAYNDWLAEFCSYDPRRFKGIAALVPSDDVPAAVGELERCVDMGFVGGMIPMLSVPDPTYEDAMYDPLWETAQGLGVPLTIHTGGIRHVETASQLIASQNAVPRRPMYMDAHARENLTAMIFGGVFERYPDLKFGVMEMGTGWVPFFLRWLDRSYLVKREGGPRPKEFGDGVAPSDFIRQNTFFGFQDEDLGVEFREFIGTDNLVYANDYPHSDCVWPRSRQVLERIFTTAGCTEEEKAKLAGGNAARVFGLDDTGSE
jgi:predicted TIM-barrel fold metal-dependent hydrolase